MMSFYIVIKSIDAKEFVKALMCCLLILSFRRESLKKIGFQSFPFPFFVFPPKYEAWMVILFLFYLFSLQLTEHAIILKLTQLL